MKSIISEFPIFKEKINKKKLVYLDNAATSQKPTQVIKVLTEFYSKQNANINRGMYTLGENATKLYEGSRTTIAKFINSFDNEIIFTRSATESLNLLSYTIQSIVSQGKNEIFLTEMEHHANLVPWQQLAQRNNMKLVFIKLKQDFSLDYEDAKNKIGKNTAIVSLTWKSNVLGTINDVEKIISLAKSNDALSIIDATQIVTTRKIDVRKLDCDFLIFTGHKMFGPTGIGVLYGKKILLEKLAPFNFGGNMISKVTLENSEWNDIPQKFEAGTPNISGAIGLGEAIKFIERVKIENIAKHDKVLTQYALKELSKIPEITIYGKNQSGIISFNVKDIHSHDVSCLLNDEGICIRAGYHCAMPLVKKLSENGVCRISFSIYNTKEDIDALTTQLKKIIKIFGSKNGKTN